MKKPNAIIVGGTDAFEVCKMFSQNSINLVELNTLLHGEQSQGWDVRLNQLTLEAICEELEKRGLRLLKKRINGFKISVEAERP